MHTLETNHTHKSVSSSQANYFIQKQLKVQFKNICHQKDAATYLNMLHIYQVLEKKEAGAKDQEPCTHT